MEEDGTEMREREEEPPSEEKVAGGVVRPDVPQGLCGLGVRDKEPLTPRFPVRGPFREISLLQSPAEPTLQKLRDACRKRPSQGRIQVRVRAERPTSLFPSVTPSVGSSTLHPFSHPPLASRSTRTPRAPCPLPRFLPGLSKLLRVPEKSSGVAETPVTS